MKNIIIGTAGHIDHGKTSLVKALTGIDADRLKEEKQRGITIDIGFADLTIGDFRFGFVDVPGHERFVKNMLAGAHGIDLVMLVVAADESVMPQTREHFDICRLLRVQSGLVALTKSDIVEEELLELSRAEIEDLVAGSFLAGAPVVPVSSRTGTGIEELKTALIRLAGEVRPKTVSAVPRLPVDRSFSIRGFGTVVTGTLVAGQLRVGDEIEAAPSGIKSRIRNIQVHGADARVALAGQRTALNLQNVGAEDLERGAVLAPAGRLEATSMIDARLDLLPSSARPLKQRTRVRFHLGTAEIMARAMILAVDPSGRAGAPATRETTVEPGGRALVQFRLERPVLALPGDRFIIRSYSPQETIGGGVVIDSLPAKHRLRDSRVPELLRRLEVGDLAARVETILEMSGPRGMTDAELARRTGATDEELEVVIGRIVGGGGAVEVAPSPRVVISPGAYQELTKAVLDLLAEHHRLHPLSLGINREEVRERVFGELRVEIFRGVIASLVERKEVAAERDYLRLESHTPELSEAEAAAKSDLEQVFRQWKLQAGTLEDAAASVGIATELARKLYTLLASESRTVKIGDMIYHHDVIEGLKKRVREARSTSPRFDVAGFKEIVGGLTRKHAIPLLEYLDRERVTRRIGNEREIL